MSKVSVIVPIYNAEKKLDKCIKSILNQTLYDLELILINDGSSDGSLQKCKKFRNIDNRVIIIDKQNEGSVLTRLRGVEASVSDYIMFVDADDWIDRIAVETLYNEIIYSDVDIVVSNSYKVLGNGLLLKKRNTSKYFSQDKIYTEKEIISDLIVAFLHGHPFPAALHGKLYKKNLTKNIGKYLGEIHFLGDDLYFNIEVFLKAKKIKVIDKSLYYYRLGGYTSKFMPYLFDDMICGYKIQKEIINENYKSSHQLRQNGISIMLLNTFKTCLFNLFKSSLTESQIKDLILMYVSNDCVMETLENSGSKSYFSQEYLTAIKYKDIEYIYGFGERMYKKTSVKRGIIKVLSFFSLI